MYVFLSNSRPLSVNAKYTEKFKQNIQEAFRKFNENAIQLEGNLYGVIYLLHNIQTQLDAYNISKPVWDALDKIAYSDDNRIKLRIAGVFDLTKPIDIIDISKMPDSVADDFLDMINAKEQHIIYVEIGILNYNLFRFGCEV